MNKKNITDIKELIVNKNSFLFYNKNHVWTQETAIGTKMVPSDTNSNLDFIKENLYIS